MPLENLFNFNETFVSVRIVMLIFILIMIHVVITASQSDIDNASPFPYGHRDSSTETILSEESELCDIALARYASPHGDLRKFVKPHLMSFVVLSPDHPLEYDRSNLELFRRFKSNDNIPGGDLPSVNEDSQIHSMVIKAILDAFEEKEKAAIEREACIREKYEGRSVAAIAAITAAISTTVTTVCATLITLHVRS